MSQGQGTPLREEVEFIAEILYQRCVLPDSGQRLSRTGRISPKTTLRHLEASECFEWCWPVHEPRFFTRTAVTQALGLLLEKYSVSIPCAETPGLSQTDWVASQSKHIQHLCKRAVSNASAWRRSNSSSSSTMDDAETQPWQLQDQRFVFSSCAETRRSHCTTYRYAGRMVRCSCSRCCSSAWTHLLALDFI